MQVTPPNCCNYSNAERFKNGLHPQLQFVSYLLILQLKFSPFTLLGSCVRIDVRTI